MDDKENNNDTPAPKPVVYGDPEYSAADDIYSQEKKVSFEEDADAGSIGEEGLDVPGSELDDAAEATGDEDEENNYYSVGGDDHNDLEESEDD